MDLTREFDRPISSEASYVRGLGHRILSREEEQDVAARILDGERSLLSALLESTAAPLELERIAAELRTGTTRLDRVLRNVDRSDDDAQRRRLLRTLALGKGLSDTKRRRRLVERLVAQRVHPSVFVRLEAAAAQADRRDADLLARARHARLEIERAKTTLVEHNLRLVVKLAHRYRNRGLPFLDLVQEGNLGLMHAIDKFDPRKGHRLNTYATWWIKQSFERALADYAPTIRIPVHLVENRARVFRAQRHAYARRGVEATPEELAERTGVPLTKVHMILGLPREPASLEAPLPNTEELRVGDRLANALPPDPERDIDRHRMEARARALLRGLGGRERLVLRLRFGLDGSAGRTLEEIGRTLSLTRERVRQIETAALAKLRARCAEQSYRPDLEV